MNELFTKENIALFGVIILFLWRIIDSLIRAGKKRENEIEKLAFEMAKYRCNIENNNFEKNSLFSYYLFYLDALENNMRPSYKKYEIMKDFDEQFNDKIKRLDDVLEKLNAVNNKLNENYEVTIADLLDKNVTVYSLWHDVKVLLKKTFKKNKVKFRSLTK